jgi:hypothetical protein
VAGKLADDVLDRQFLVDPMHIIEVDPLDVEPLEAAFELEAGISRIVVDSPPARRAFAHDAELARQHDLVASVSDGAPDELLVMAVAIDVCRVDQRDPQIDRAVKRPDRGRIVGAPVTVRQAHGAIALPADFKRAQLRHQSSFRDAGLMILSVWPSVAAGRPVQP